jgi:hypothetical protein
MPCVAQPADRGQLDIDSWNRFLCRSGLRGMCRFNRRILLANLLQSSRSTFSRGSFPSFFAFQEGMMDTHISALGGWPTVSARYRGTMREGPYCQHDVHRNAIQKSMSSCWLAVKFLDGKRVTSIV